MFAKRRCDWELFVWARETAHHLMMRVWEAGGAQVRGVHKGARATRIVWDPHLLRATHSAEGM